MLLTRTAQGYRIEWATKASHRQGDISRPAGDYAIVQFEDEDDYVGYWLTGPGLVNVRFPKSTTRELTEVERETLGSLSFKV